MAWIDWDVRGLKEVGYKHIAVKFVVVFLEIHPYIIEVTAQSRDMNVTFK